MSPLAGGRWMLLFINLRGMAVPFDVHLRDWFSEHYFRNLEDMIYVGY